LACQNNILIKRIDKLKFTEAERKELSMFYQMTFWKNTQPSSNAIPFPAGLHEFVKANLIIPTKENKKPKAEKEKIKSSGNLSSNSQKKTLSMVTKPSPTLPQEPTKPSAKSTVTDILKAAGIPQGVGS
jgi:hypothetical protein